MLSSYIYRLYFIMAPKRNLRSQSKKGVKKMQTKRRGGSISAPNSKRRRTTRQQSKAEKETTKLPRHVPLSSSSSEMSSIKGRYPIWEASRSTYSCDSTLRSYVPGKSPKLSVPWWRCDYMYIPVNNEESSFSNDNR
nr:uncharacterized protein LOC125423244 [Ziziphus jujuba var. spinosa]